MGASASVPEGAEERVAKVFKELDTNESGSVDATELGVAFKHAGLDKFDAALEARNWIDAFDKDGNTRVK